MLHIERCDASHLRRLATYTIAGGLLIEAESSSGFHFVYDYDAHGRLTRWSDGSKTANSYDYDERGRCVRAQGSGGFFVGTFEYLDDQQTCRVRTGRGHTTTYRFDGAHRLTSITSPLGHTESWAYDRHGQLIVETNAAGDAFHFRYDPVSGLLTRTIDPEGNSGEIHYDDDLRPIAFVDPAGHTWIYQRSERGAITSITDADDNTYRYTYNERGQTTAITRPDGLSRALTYDAHSRLVEETDWRGQTHRYTYDHQDRLIEARDAQGRADAFFYDPRDRLTALRHADGHQIRYEYDSEHNLTALTDENGHTTRAEYGAFDLHLATIDPEGRRYDFSYDPDHLLLTEVRAPDGRRYRLQRDAAGRVTHETDYHGATTHYQHDAAGRLIERRGAARQHLRYRYDRRGAVLAVEADGESTTFAYDQLGRLIRAANATTTLEWTYDALGRVTRAAQDGDVLEYTYDSSGRCVERTLRPGIWQKTAHTTHFTHDPAGQLTHLHLPCEQTLQIERDDLGRPTRLSTERGLQLDQEFDLRGALTRQHLTPSPSSRAAPLRRTYTYDPANNPRALDDARWGATQFSYDKSDRVIAAERPGPAAEHFRYGPAGQLAAADHPGAPVPFTFAPDGRLHRAGDTEHTYDDAGRLIARTLLRRGFRPARWTFTWDSHDRLIVAGTPDGHTWRYTYDPLGRRIRKFCPNTREAVLYLWDGDVLLREIHLQPRGPTHDQQVVKIVHWHHEPGTFHPLAREQDGEAHFVVTDHLGTPRELVDPSGQITWRARHTTWGALHPDPESDPTTCPIRFQGQYEDPETGLHYNRFRYYDPNTATYLTPDPLGLAGGLQPTAYVHNPNAWIDPLGLNGRRCKTLEKAFGNLETKAHQRGNSGIRTAMTRREADKLGKRWVGPNFTIQRGSNGEVFYVSSNGLRRYRPPTDKHSDYATTGRQANFEERNSTKSCWDKEGYDSNSVGNVHVHIKD
jgi:RHS repeat-associated protein